MHVACGINKINVREEKQLHTSLLLSQTISWRHSWLCYNPFFFSVSVVALWIEFYIPDLQSMLTVSIHVESAHSGITQTESLLYRYIFTSFFHCRLFDLSGGLQFNSVHFVQPNITNLPPGVLHSVHIRHPCPRTSHRIRKNSQKIEKPLSVTTQKAGPKRTTPKFRGIKKGL